MTFKTDKFIIGNNATDTQNFLLDTDGVGGLRIRQKSDGSGTSILSTDANGLVTFGQGKQMTISTSQATTSGASKDFLNIPSWAKRITVGLNGTSDSLGGTQGIQLGTGGTPTITGYASGSSYITTTNSNTSNYSDKIGIYGISALAFYSGAVVLTHIGSNTWVAHGTIGTALAYTITVCGVVTLAGTLDNIRFLVSTGAFDAGSVNIMYEG
jgi:hypothetical protein